MKSGRAAIRSASRRIEASLRELTVRPSWTAIAQKMALPVASPVGGDGKADRLQRPDLPAAAVAGVDRPREIHPVDCVHLRLGERRLRRVVDEPARVLPLAEPLRRQGILIPVEAEEHLLEGRRDRRPPPRQEGSSRSPGLGSAAA